MKTDSTFDQTQFMSESPLYEEIKNEEPPQPELSAEEIVANKQKQLKTIMIIVGVVLLVGGFIFLLKSLRSKTTPEAEQNPEEEKLTEVISGPFTLRLLELEKELELADPSQEDLPFPPIDFDLSLEK